MFSPAAPRAVIIGSVKCRSGTLGMMIRGRFLLLCLGSWIRVFFLEVSDALWMPHSADGICAHRELPPSEGSSWSDVYTTDNRGQSSWLHTVGLQKLHTENQAAGLSSQTLITWGGEGKFLIQIKKKNVQILIFGRTSVNVQLSAGGEIFLKIRLLGHLGGSL